jgi:hypothetical protein
VLSSYGKSVSFNAHTRKIPALAVSRQEAPVAIGDQLERLERQQQYRSAQSPGMGAQHGMGGVCE